MPPKSPEKAKHQAAAIEAALSGHPLLSLLGEPARRKLARSSRVIAVTKGEMICVDGAPAEHVWLVVDGEVKLVKFSSTGAALLIDLALPGQLFCAVYYLPNPVYPYAAVAGKPSHVIALRSRDLKSGLKGNASLLQALCEETCRQLCRAQQLRGLSMERVEVRIAHLLLYLHQRYGRVIPQTRETIAELAGTTVETSIRTIRKMERAGLVVTRRGSIEIRAAAGLRTFADRRT